MASPEGPSFLTSAPVVPPDPDAAQRKLIVPISTSPYREQGELSQPKPRVARASTPPPVARKRKYEPPPSEPIGDRAGEHLLIDRGKYDAWIYVVLAFAMQALLIAALPIIVFVQVLPLGDLGYAIAATIGLAGAWWCFHDRWRCIEAWSSKLCSGLANLTVLYLPFVAFVYANARVIGKLRR